MVRVVKKSAERRSDIVKAAGLLFKTKEYDKTTMQDVMETLGIAKGTIYHYFKSKEALLEAVIDDIVDMHIALMEAIIQEIEGTALKKIQALVEKGKMPMDNREFLDRLNSRGYDAMNSRLLAASLIKEAPLYATLIQQGCEEGLFQTETPLECAEFFLTAIQFLTDLGIYPWTQEDLNRRICAFPKLIEQQLKAPSGSFQFMLNRLKEIGG